MTSAQIQGLCAGGLGILHPHGWDQATAPLHGNGLSSYFQGKGFPLNSLDDGQAPGKTSWAPQSARTAS